MTTMTAAKITYRKTKSNEWVAYGPAAAIHLGCVTVTKRDGTTKMESVIKVGRPFAVNGVEMAYGYLAPKPAPTTQRAPRRESCDGDCWSFGRHCWSCGS